MMDKIKKIQDVLMDVIALSKKDCDFPIEGKLAYATEENFVGRLIDGYSPETDELCLMTPRSAAALCQVQNYLNKKQLGLYIFDAYRPLRAVKDFVKWFYEPICREIEIERKKLHYPHIEKVDLGRLGYIAAEVSKHNFGHTVDLTLIHLKTKQFLDMGTCFDYFDELSHITATPDELGEEAYNNRNKLSEAMQKFGFMPYEKEYWHFNYHVQE